MPAYLYRCLKCKDDFDVIKRIADIDQTELCVRCGSDDTARIIVAPNLDKTSMSQPYYEPALGCMINSASHKKRILKQKGLEEIGNTSPDTMYRNLELETKKRIAARWDKV